VVSGGWHPTGTRFGSHPRRIGLHARFGGRAPLRGQAGYCSLWTTNREIFRLGCAGVKPRALLRKTPAAQPLRVRTVLRRVPVRQIQCFHCGKWIDSHSSSQAFCSGNCRKAEYEYRVRLGHAWNGLPVVGFRRGNAGYGTAADLEASDRPWRVPGEGRADTT